VCLSPEVKGPVKLITHLHIVPYIFMARGDIIIIIININIIMVLQPFVGALGLFFQFLNPIRSR
jgi:hypothetical protein